jgi:hypothetical protein
MGPTTEVGMPYTDVTYVTPMVHWEGGIGGGGVRGIMPRVAH